jgi:transcriptional regulator with XRE-family HTH domain
VAAKKDQVTFGQRLVELRQARGMTQRELAAAAGLTQAAYQRLETDVAGPRLSTALALAKALRVPLGQLAGE